MVRYEDFGAVGDGVTNDYEAIYNAHEYANNTCQKVVATSGKTYYIGVSNGKCATIKTDTDWGDATFIIDDDIIPEDSEDNKLPLFKVASDYKTVQVSDDVISAINARGGIEKNTEKIDTGLGYPAIIRIVNEKSMRYIRYGNDANNGRPQLELLLVDENGCVDEQTPLVYDYEHVSYILARRSDDTPITISGGSFITKVSSLDRRRYYARGISVSRNNVTMKNLDHKITGECSNPLGPIYSGIVFVYDAANVLIEDTYFQAHKYYGAGTYDLLVEFSLNVTMRGCRQHNFYTDQGPLPCLYYGYWGIMGSNFSKNVVYENCILTRFDAHAGLYNARISDSVLATISVTGGGTMIIENTEVIRHEFISLRGDFGSTFDGEIILKNIRQNSHLPDKTRLISITWKNHDFGYPCHHPNVTIDGYAVNVSEEISFIEFRDNTVEHMDEAHLEVFKNGEKNNNPYYPPKRITIKNTSAVITIPNHEMYKDTEICGAKIAD